MRNKRGSNQYQVKHKTNLHYLGWFALAVYLLIFGRSIILSIPEVEIAEAQIVSPLVSPTPSPTTVPSPTPTPEPDKQIKAYIKTIFRDEAQTACAVAMAESGLRPKALLSAEKEHSVGIMQINLQSKHAKVHWDRVPGDDLAQKQRWLEDPKNNILMAHWIYTHSGFNPWSAFTNGAYEKFLDTCK